MSVYDKIYQAFSNKSKNIYLREDIITKVRDFLKSTSQYTLHITGNPGVGKTSIVRHVCHDSLYLNAYTDTDIKKQILTTHKQVCVIDEYDKLEIDPLHKFLLYHFKNTRKKLITLSNTLRTTSLVIKPYTSYEIENILKQKFSKEIHNGVCDVTVMKYISKKYSDVGDLRLVFDYVLNNYNENTHKIEIVDMNTSVYKQDNLTIQKDKQAIDIADVNGARCSQIQQSYCNDKQISTIGKQEMKYGKQEMKYGKQEMKCGKQEMKYGKQEMKYGKQEMKYGKQEMKYGKQEMKYGKPWHHMTIKKLCHYTKRKAFSNYLDKCDELGIPPLQRNDFNAVYDIFDT